MKNRVIIKANIEDVYDAITQVFRDTYEKEKGKQPTVEEMKRGLTFETLVKTSGKQEVRATIKCLKYDKPNQFNMEYRSQRYHKIEKSWLTAISDNKTELLFTKVEEYINNGIVVKTKGSFEDNTVKNVGIVTKIQFIRLANQIKQMKKNKK